MSRWIRIILSMALAAALVCGALGCFAEGTQEWTEGSIVTFGRYPQTEEGTDDTPIEWTVMEVDRLHHRALLLSRYGLDAQLYHANRREKKITWETCSLRTWLNNDFLNRAFTAEEQSAILLTDVDNSTSQGYSKWNTPGGKNTQDSVFLLSYAEANRYLQIPRDYVDGIPRVAPTAYAVRQGAGTNAEYRTTDGRAAGWWWLRSPGINQYNAAVVADSGVLIQQGIHEAGNGIGSGCACVRPALWIDLDVIGTGTSTEEGVVYGSAEYWELFRTKGSTVIYGRYQQEEQIRFGPQIEWIVLDVDEVNHRALLLSKNVLDDISYNREEGDTTWENCTLRAWLNGDFLGEAFTPEEQAAILLTDVDNSDGQGYSEWDTTGGNNTQDYLFLLSVAEANRYLNVTRDNRDNRASRAASTAYAAAHGARPDGDGQTEDGRDAADWLLRSPGQTQDYVSRVTGEGGLGARPARSGGGTRPAFWINLDVIGGGVLADGWEAIHAARQWNLFRTAGNVVTLGRYPQTEEGTDETPVEWIVLEYDEAGNRTLLLSRYGLDTKPYNTEQADVTWETCGLRTWLNDDFLNRAFSPEEQSAILLTDVDNSDAQGYNGFYTSGGNNTRDSVFLLSCAEANRYLDVMWGDNMGSRVAPTAYAVRKGARTGNDNRTADGNLSGWWWLRSPGDTQDCALDVHEDGSLAVCSVNYPGLSVRPALWVDPDLIPSAP